MTDNCSQRLNSQDISIQNRVQEKQAHQENKINVPFENGKDEKENLASSEITEEI